MGERDELRARAELRSALFADLRAVFDPAASEEDIAYLADKLWEKGWVKR